MTKNYNLEIISPDRFAALVADELVAAIGDAVELRGECSIVLAGGKTPADIYRLFTRPPRDSEVDWQKVKFFWGDDRFVPHDHSGSNYKLAEETFLKNLAIAKESIFPINTSLPDATAAARDYDLQIRQALRLGEQDLPEFDLVLLGIGEDGHTASLFPHSKELNLQGRLACAALAPVEPKERVSMTAEALFNAKRIYFIVKGGGKANILSRILNDSDLSTEQVPAVFFKSAKGKVTWFIDSEAAQKLS